MKIVVNILFLILLLSHHADSNAIVFYVSPFGDDTWNGLAAKSTGNDAEGPFRTLARARTAIRILKSNKIKPTKITVKIVGGEYFLSQPLRFDLRDSGWHDKEIIWEGVEEKPAILNAGRALLDCSSHEANTWICDANIPNLDRIKPADQKRIKGDIPGFGLFVNSRRLQLARWPNKGWAHIKQPVDENQSFTFFDQPGLHINDSKEAAVHIWPGNDWYDQYIGIASIDLAHKIITLSNPTAYPLSPGRRFAILNHEAQLDAPWEWIYDQKNKRIRFILPKGEKPSSIIISYLESAIELNGARNLIFRNLKVRNTTKAGIQIRNGQNIQLSNLEVSHTGGRGIAAQNSSQIIIKESQIHNTGRGGILLTGGNRKNLTRSENQIINTHIHHVGQTLANHSPAIDIKGVGTTIRHSLIEYLPGLALWIGGNEHLIEKNEIHHVCEQASDCGAIYSGRDWSFRGNIIRFNSIHDLYGFGLKHVNQTRNEVEYGTGGIRGVYLDDGASGFHIMGNIFQNAGFINVQVGGGRDNIIENNLFLTDQHAIWVDDRWPGYKWEINRKRLASSPYRSRLWQARYPSLAKPMRNETWPEGNQIVRNIFIAKNSDSVSVRYLMPANSNTIGNNIVWNDKHTFRVDYHLLDYQHKKGGASWTEWIAEGVERRSINIDPCIKVQDNRMSSCSPERLKEINFQPLPDDIGLQMIEK